MKYIFVSGRRFITFASIMNNHPKSPIIDLQQQQLLLRMEYEHEKEEFKRQTETMGVARKVKRGLCWYPASPGRSYYNSLNQLVIDITRTENKEIEHSFEFGRPVCFFRQSFDGKVNYMNFIATVSYADDERMVVVLPSAGALLELQTEEVLGVQLYFDETSYRAMFEALEDTIRAKGNRLAELRDTLLGTQKPGFRELYPVRFPWLNSTQETAVNKVLCTRDVAIVHGPPGTGKTTTLVEAIYETLHREPQVLVCAQSNTAVDWICEKLVDRGVPVLRIGNPTRVNDKMLSFTYERRFENHSAYPELWGIRKSIREMGSRMRRGSYSEREGMRSRMSRLRDRATELEILINADLFDTRSRLLDRHPKGRPCDSCRRPLPAPSYNQMYRSRPWRTGPHSNGKGRAAKTFCRLAAQSAIPDARSNHALSLRMVLQRRTGSRTGSAQPGYP